MVIDEVPTVTGVGDDVESQAGVVNYDSDPVPTGTRNFEKLPEAAELIASRPTNI
jgi:hypothetical protein